MQRSSVQREAAALEIPQEQIQGDTDQDADEQMPIAINPSSHVSPSATPARRSGRRREKAPSARGA
jgi:hypothetical protein